MHNLEIYIYNMSMHKESIKVSVLGNITVLALYRKETLQYIMYIYNTHMYYVRVCIMVARIFIRQNFFPII